MGHHPTEPRAAGWAQGRAAERGRACRAVAAAAVIALLLAPWAIAAVERLTPKVLTIKTSMDVRQTVYLYLPATTPPPQPGAEGRTDAAPGAIPAAASGGAPVIFLSGDWGWRPLQQDTASHLVSQRRPVLGLDATEYFRKPAETEGLKADLGIFRELVNDRSGRPKDAPVILVGFGYGAEMIPYLLNRAGADRVLGVLLIAPDKDGAAVFRAGVQLKLPTPEGEAFDVAAEIRRMPSLPAVLMQGAQDTAAHAQALHAVVRGPRRLVIVPGGDHQFKAVRDAYFEQVSLALRWIDSAPVR